MIISLRNISKEYQLDDYSSITPVRDITLNIVAGEMIMIIGRSGSGKTTLLNLTAGLIKPTTGEVRIDGRSISNMSDREVSLLRSREVGFIFQFPSLIPSLTILENVLMPTVFAHKRLNLEIERRAAEILNLVGLTERMGVYPKQLSAGEQKRAVIARSLINQPQIILADEPTSDLDEQTEQEIMQLLLEIQAGGVTFIIVTHSLQLLPCSTRAFKMENSTLHLIDKSVGTAEPLRAEENQVYVLE